MNSLMAPHVQGTPSSSTPTCKSIRGKTWDRSLATWQGHLALQCTKQVSDLSCFSPTRQQHFHPWPTPSNIQWSPQLQWRHRSLPRWEASDGQYVKHLHPVSTPSNKPQRKRSQQHVFQHQATLAEVSNIGFITVHGLNEGHIAPYTDIEL